MGEVALMMMAFGGAWFGSVTVNHLGESAGEMTLEQRAVACWTGWSRYFQVIRGSPSVFVVDI